MSASFFISPIDGACEIHATTGNKFSRENDDFYQVKSNNHCYNLSSTSNDFGKCG